MRGRHDIVVRNNRVQFTLSVRRNITILRGDSATGKTTLIEMISDFEAQGTASGVELRCDVPCTVLSGARWKRDLEGISGYVVFIDEGNEWVSSRDFRDAIEGSDNYYVIATRERLDCLPYSVEEVYRLKNTTSVRSSQRYRDAKRYFTSAKRIYSTIPTNDAPIPEEVIVEDSGSGFRFFSALSKRSGARCVSAGGRGNVYRKIMESHVEHLLVIADGAAFGSEMERVHHVCRERSVQLYLPESFEWLLLSSGLVRDDELPAIMRSPEDFVDSREYLSWERFFAATLVRMTAGTYLRYAKGSLSDSWLEERSLSAVSSAMPRTGL
ncbi:hypothetical protein [Thermophilibacter mediterraneus]|uniref:hypothetical protein n=1 Tax=Thermophilibacter mediterraneus TaxID=1871031 RepID=UPI000930BACB|nr:hypothetical protein [Thermophilibacter mediterraneus]